ncbi:MAG TPA: Sir2 family NAD+-dependent deacetylase [Stellaceae bacterium]|nr:Sir2 family NAD+-dependent deacetylase [Stellaceae bacterium]
MPEPGRIVILTGAGVSRESGIETFRDKDGIWSRVRIEDVATPEAFVRNPVAVHEFYNWRRRRLLDPAVVPNAAHAALARLDEAWDGALLLVTQNIDDLHERAGSRRLLHMHGEHLKARCAACDHVVDWREDLSVELACGACGRRGGMRPHVVWFGEMPHGLEEIDAALSECHLFIAIGTSGAVYPAAGFVERAMAAGARTVELNLEPTQVSRRFDEHVYGPASEIVPAFVERLLADRL